MTLIEYPELTQGTEEWHTARRGLITASVVGKLLTVGPPDAQTVACPLCGVEAGPCLSLSAKKPTPLKTVHAPRTAAAAAQPAVIKVAEDDYSHAVTMTLAAERITGWTEDTPLTSDMWRGVEAEPFARDVYSGHYEAAREFGFFVREERNWRLGYSPDGLVGDDGLIEIKAPRAKTHVRTILADAVPDHYMAQLQAGLLVTGRDWIDYVSFVGGMPLYRKRIEPEGFWFDAITAACIAFEANVAQIIADYEQRVADMPMTDRLDFDLKVA